MIKIKHICEQLKEPFFKYVPISVAWIYLCIIAVFYALVTAYFPTQNGDNIEHIHSSFLVATGSVPYRDFFQHHNPLLWYLFAPLAWLFRYNSTVAEVACLFALLFFLKSLVYVYRIISDFLGNRLWGVIAAVAIAMPTGKIYAIDLRPDNFMILCLMGGLYYYFSYLRDQQCRSLVFAFGWFCLSFLFAQKALFPLFILGLSGLYFWYKKEIKTADMIKALIFPVAVLVAFFGYLYYYDIIGVYFLSNYTFNLNLANGFELSKVVVLPFYILVLTILGWLGVIYFCFNPNKYFGVIVALFICEFFQRRFYFSPYAYYYWLMVYLSVLCAVPMFVKFNQYGRLFGLAVIVCLCYFGGKSIIIYRDFIKATENRPYLPDFVTRNITPCDYVFNGDGLMYNIFAKDPAYYWQLIGQLDVIGEKTGIHPRPDINALIKKYKPKFVFGASYFNKFADEGGVKEIVHYVDQDLIEKYYVPTAFYSVYQLKPEFNNRKCVQDSLGQWNYQKDTDVK